MYIIFSKRQKHKLKPLSKCNIQHDHQGFNRKYSYLQNRSPITFLVRTCFCFLPSLMTANWEGGSMAFSPHLDNPKVQRMAIGGTDGWLQELSGDCYL